jgi:ethanolamine ammonia-lyase small subunit
MTGTLPDLPLHWDAGDEPAHAPAPPPDPWTTLRRHTPARISLGRSGTSLPTHEVLRFAAAHAGARDAVHLPLDVDGLLADLGGHGLDAVAVTSRASSRREYLTRPDLGRQLAPESHGALASDADAGLCVVIGDGLSAIAAQMHAAPLLAALRENGVDIGCVVVATQARVALGDEIAQRVGAEMVLMLLGERPGLSSPDSLGAYLTWAPRPGRADSERNCVSNIRPAGLPVREAAARIAWLAREAQRRRVTGIGLKDDSDVAVIAGDDASRLPPVAST